jgi:2-C-methyl-D-erythritol 4-phosphate cytidylyltransferase
VRDGKKNKHGRGRRGRAALISALIPAAGRGERLGMGPKALLELRGKTLLERAIDAFSGIADEILVALPETHLDLNFGTARVVLGGATRQESVLNLLNAARGEIVLIHDAARPFLPRAVIERVLEDVRRVGAATAASPAADTLVNEVDAHWSEVLDRSRIRAVQTPQGFRSALLLEAHRRALEDGVAATDDAGLVARLGHPVALSMGDERLFKVTRAGDWALATAFAVLWDKVSDEGGFEP